MAVIILIAAGMVLTVGWMHKSKSGEVGGYVSKVLTRGGWVAIHLTIVGAVAVKFGEGYIDKVMTAAEESAWNEFVALLGAVIFVLIMFNLFFEAGIGIGDIKKYDFVVYTKDIDRLLTYLMNFLAVMGFFYPAINMNGPRVSKDMLACALAALIDMVTLDLYKIAVYPLGVGSWVNQKIKPVIDGRCHRIREGFQKVESKKTDLSHKTFSFKRKHYYKINLVNWENKEDSET